jgi:3-methyladenine DNA glycosylase AlkD
MIPEEILARLEAVGTAQNRKIYARHGVKEPFYGVSFANLDKIAKEIRKDKTIDRNALAQELWASGVHDARLLATKIAEPRTMEPSIYDAWVQNLDNYVITDGFSNLVGSSPYALEKMQAWIQDPGEWISTAGWNLLGQLAMNDPALSEEFFTGYLPVIERSILKTWLYREQKSGKNTP